jgi:PRTRC genetic system protein B
MIKQLNSQRLRARSALLIYELEKRPRDQFGFSEEPAISHFVTQHEITPKGQLGVGHPLSRTALKDLCELINPGLSDVAFLEENVLAYLPDTVMLWWVPASTRFLAFTKQTKIASGTAPVPAMLLMATVGNLSTWALKENRRPTLDTMLYNSPFFNVHEGGGCCMGNIEIPKQVRAEDREMWETCFFDGTMSTDLPPKLDGATGMDLWNGLISGKKKKFPVKYLTECRPLREVFELARGRYA